MLAAASRGRANVVLSLLATGTDPDYCQKEGDPALFVALEYGHLQVTILNFLLIFTPQLCGSL